MLVTHQLQYLQDVEHVVLMNGGAIEAQGPYRELQAANAYPLLATLAQQQAARLARQSEQQRDQLEQYVDGEGAAQEGEGEDKVGFTILN